MLFRSDFEYLFPFGWGELWGIADRTDYDLTQHQNTSGKDLNEALTILKFTPGKGSELIEKVVKSAAANAENNHDMNPDELYVAEINANQGPTMKRWRPGTQGRAGMILKRTSNIYVTLKEKEAPVKAVKKEAEEEVR